MNNKKVFVATMFLIILTASLFMFHPGRRACIKTNNDVFFVETLRIYSSGVVSFEMDDKKFYNNNATYFYVENEEDCGIIREIFD